jgi:prefoldin subunit 5
MKRILAVFAATLSLGLIVLAQQSLGDAARSLKKDKTAEKKPAKVYTNDNLPSGGSINVVGSAAPEKASVTESEKPAPTDKKEKKDGLAEIQEQWKQRITDAKKDIARQENELEELRRGARLRVANYRGMRDDVAWTFIQADLADLDKNQKSVDEAKQKLEDLRDEGRKAGISPAVLD